jgi:MFS transporter, PAT family, beta-lactamase induction signal transducer AmpG
VGYAIVAEVGVNRGVMYTAMAVEAGTTGMGTGAFSVLLLRLTQKRFSATQYALFSSIFALGRTLSGPPAGSLVDALGWRNFFLASILFAIPGMVMLHRFVPWGSRDVPEQPEDLETAPTIGEPVTVSGLLSRGAVGALVGTAIGYVGSALLIALKGTRRGAAPFDLGLALHKLLNPERAVDFIDLFGPPVFGVVLGFGVAAYVAARHGMRRAER